MNPWAFSIGFRSLRWMFSTSAASNTCWSSKSTTWTGTSARPGGLGGPQPPLAGDELEPVADLPDDQRLQDAVGLDAVGQRLRVRRRRTASAAGTGCAGSGRPASRRSAGSRSSAGVRRAGRPARGRAGACVASMRSPPPNRPVLSRGGVIARIADRRVGGNAGVRASGPRRRVPRGTLATLTRSRRRRRRPFHVERLAARLAALARGRKWPCPRRENLNYDPARSVDGPEPADRARPASGPEPAGDRYGPTERPAGEEVSRLGLARTRRALTRRLHRGDPFAPTRTRGDDRVPRLASPLTPGRRPDAPSRASPPLVVQERCAWTRLAARSCFAATAPPTRLGAVLPVPVARRRPPAAAARHALPQLPRPALAGHGHQPRRTTTGCPPSSRSAHAGDLEATIAQVRRLNAAAVVVAGDGRDRGLPRATPTRPARWSSPSTPTAGDRRSRPTWW